MDNGNVRIVGIVVIDAEMNRLTNVVPVCQRRQPLSHTNARLCSISISVIRQFYSPSVAQQIDLEIWKNSNMCCVIKVALSADFLI